MKDVQVLRIWERFLAKNGCISHLNFEGFLGQFLDLAISSPEYLESMNRTHKVLPVFSSVSDEEFLELLEPIAGRTLVKSMSIPDQVEKMAMLLSVLDAPKNVLDVGCGPIPAAVFLKGRGVIDTDIICLDASEKMLQAVRSFSEELATEVETVLGEIKKLPFGDSSFDLVVCMDVLPSTHAWRMGVRELARVASRDLLLCFSPKDPHVRVDLMSVLALLEECGMNIPRFEYRDAKGSLNGRPFILATKRGVAPENIIQAKAI